MVVRSRFGCTLRIGCYAFNPIHPIGNSVKKQKPCTKVEHLVKRPYKIHNLMGILWAHTGAIGCIGLN